MTLPLRPITATKRVVIGIGQPAATAPRRIEIEPPSEEAFNQKADKLMRAMADVLPGHLPGEIVELRTAKYKVGPHGNFIKL